jgi:hypothetical protein
MQRGVPDQYVHYGRDRKNKSCWTLTWVSFDAGVASEQKELHYLDQSVW